MSPFLLSVRSHGSSGVERRTVWFYTVKSWLLLPYFLLFYIFPKCYKAQFILFFKNFVLGISTNDPYYHICTLFVPQKAQWTYETQAAIQNLGKLLSIQPHSTLTMNQLLPNSRVTVLVCPSLSCGYPSFLMPPQEFQ